MQFIYFFHFQVANIESASIGLVITIILTTSISIIVIAIALFICKRHKQYEGKYTYVLSGNTKRFNPDSDLKSQISSIAHDYKRESWEEQLLRFWRKLEMGTLVRFSRVNSRL